MLYLRKRNIKFKFMLGILELSDLAVTVQFQLERLEPIRTRSGWDKLNRKLCEDQLWTPFVGLLE